MSTVTRPKGPLPARVYWTRRLALLLLLVLVGWLAIRWVGGDGGSDAAQPPPVTETSDQEPDGQRTSRKGNKKSRNNGRNAEVRTVAETFQRPKKNCDLTTVVVEPAVSEPAYAGAPVAMTLRISTTGTDACALGIDAEHLLVSIESGSETVWDSDRCDRAIPIRELALQPRWSALVDLTWSGRYAGRNCAPDARWAEPGSYTVHAAVLEGEPGETEFELTKRPRSQDGDGDNGDDSRSNDNGNGDAAESNNSDGRKNDRANTGDNDRRS